MALEWKDEFDCGVAKVNEQHQQLVGLLYTLEQMIVDGIESGPQVDSLLDNLASDTVAHFSLRLGGRAYPQCGCPVEAVCSLN